MRLVSMAGTLPDSFLHPLFLGAVSSVTASGEIQKGPGPAFLSLQMSRVKGDEEEYWNSSKFKAFTFDDEDDGLSQVGVHKR